MKATVDRDVCIGCGMCESLCPEVFQLDDDVISTVIVEVIPPQFEPCAQEAQEECPVSAITVA
jgi:ferredoxin